MEKPCQFIMPLGVDWVTLMEEEVWDMLPLPETKEPPEGRVTQKAGAETKKEKREKERRNRAGFMGKSRARLSGGKNKGFNKAPPGKAPLKRGEVNNP